MNIVYKANESGEQKPASPLPIKASAYRSNKPNIREAYKKRFDEREVWHKIVVKILRWKEDQAEKNESLPLGKITTKEWTTYSKSIYKTNVMNGKSEITKRLKDIKNLITKNGGFE